MKIIMCFVSYLSPELRLAGGTTHFIENLKRWHNSREEFYILTTQDGNYLLNNLSMKSIPRHAVSSSRFLYTSTVGMTVSLLLRALRLLFQDKPRGFPAEADVICTESHFLPDVIAAIMMRRYYPRATLISYLHHIIPAPTRRRYHPLLQSAISRYAQSLSLWLMKRYGFYIFTFPAVKSQLLDMGFPEEKIKCISNGVDTKYIETVSPAIERFDACFLGNAIPRKGVLDLVNVWRMVCDKVPNAKLAIMGTGRKRDIEKLGREFATKKLDNNVRLLGYLPEREKFATLKSSSVFLFPSYEEGWGIAVCEAMACGLPVIAYDLPAYKDFFRKGIVTVPIGYVNDFAQTTFMLLENDEARSKLVEEAKDQASQYDWDKIAAEELLLIKEICSLRAGA